MKEWYSALELSELLNKSLRSIQKNSKLQNWRFQVREGKTREYHIDNLPLEIKSEILNKLKGNEHTVLLQSQDVIS